MTGAYIRILMVSEMGLSCGQRRFLRRLFFFLPRDDASPCRSGRSFPSGTAARLCRCQKQSGGMPIEKIPITADIMRIDTRTQAVDMQQIDNRRFMFDPDTGILVLGRQYAVTSLMNSSHAVELADAGITEGFDKFVRGWIGTGGEYPKGVIHFAPCVDMGNTKLFDRAFDTLEMFRENGALAGTVIRGFGNRWEQPLSAILTDCREPEQKPSVREQLKKTPEGKAVRHKKENQQER